MPAAPQGLLLQQERVTALRDQRTELEQEHGVGSDLSAHLTFTAALQLLRASTLALPSAWNAVPPDA